MLKKALELYRIKPGVMKKIYSLYIISSLLLLFGCSKDFLKSYDDRIIGTWRIDDIDKYGLGGSINDLPLKQGGNLTFMKDGSMTYTTPSGDLFKGTWDIKKKTINSGDESKVYRSLQITTVNFTSQQVIGEYYDDINFVGTNHLKAWIYLDRRTFVTHLRR
jgi:hypothetical protein